jgi:hypothetical protein
MTEKTNLTAESAEVAELSFVFGSLGIHVVDIICRGDPCGRPRLGGHKATPLPHEILKTLIFLCALRALCGKK